MQGREEFIGLAPYCYPWRTPLARKLMEREHRVHYIPSYSKLHISGKAVVRANGWTTIRQDSDIEYNFPLTVPFNYVLVDSSEGHGRGFIAGDDCWLYHVNPRANAPEITRGRRIQDKTEIGKSYVIRPTRHSVIVMRSVLDGPSVWHS